MISAGHAMMGGMAWNNAQSGVSIAQRVDSFLSGVPAANYATELPLGGFPGYDPRFHSVDPTRGVHAAAFANFGDSVVNGAQDVREAFRNTINHIKEIMAGGMEGMGTAQFVQIQIDIMQLNITLEFSTKVSEKGSTALQTLFRNQS
jgi:hypothetical protein